MAAASPRLPGQARPRAHWVIAKTGEFGAAIGALSLADTSRVASAGERKIACPTRGTLRSALVHGLCSTNNPQRFAPTTPHIGALIASRARSITARPRLKE